MKYSITIIFILFISSCLAQRAWECNVYVSPFLRQLYPINVKETSVGYYPFEMHNKTNQEAAFDVVKCVGKRMGIGIGASIKNYRSSFEYHTFKPTNADNTTEQVLQSRQHNLDLLAYGFNINAYYAIKKWQFRFDIEMINPIKYNANFVGRDQYQEVRFYTDSTFSVYHYYYAILEKHSLPTNPFQFLMYGGNISYSVSSHFKLNGMVKFNLFSNNNLYNLSIRGRTAKEGFNDFTKEYSLNEIQINTRFLMLGIGFSYHIPFGKLK